VAARAAASAVAFFDPNHGRIIFASHDNVKRRVVEKLLPQGKTTFGLSLSHQDGSGIDRSDASHDPLNVSGPKGRLMNHRVLIAVAVLAVAALPAPAQPEGDLRVEQLNLGTYWGGAPIDQRDLIGKVTLVEIWGS
jgi:hypothetical protein